MRFTATQRYVAGLYEEAVDACLDLDEVRRYLMERGVVKTPGQVAYELEHTYGFIGYAEKHQPRPALTVAEWDKAVDLGMATC